MPFPAYDRLGYLIDFPNVPAWEDGVLEVRQTTPGAPGVGTELVARRVYAGRESLVDCRIVDWQEGRVRDDGDRGRPGPSRPRSAMPSSQPAIDARS